jgi:alanine dehydrogenase
MIAAIAGADAAARPRQHGRGGALTGEGMIMRYDLAIIGSGSAAFAATITARDAGASVVMIAQAAGRVRPGLACPHAPCFN